jgi:hypothetical protein
MKALIETGDLRSVDEDVLLAYWFNEYETGIKLNGLGRQGHGSTQYSQLTTRNTQHTRHTHTHRTRTTHTHTTALG